ncbi:uncharacterized protein si:dkey-92i15.4 [Anguilla anguilla]|uniref:uncharacterized protein si:dkey-92i15.4 n=1 Tax=Anguilla anguilla TaxID=7936 RepID=UPI0015A95FA9|nr:uncharacterized protein si:dkey-92i15.4 [Anguilla anguilla]XP_035260536.1 uncharacterized protein si:dkey-92i15.4 [Anguilla anguilla]XP_035260544.1 uncharacterized protein si:dkey-92i15.4 [Anguilla anguilla]
MDLYLESTLLPESSNHALAPVDAEQVSRISPAKTETHPTAGFVQSTAPRFIIRSAKSLSLDLGTRNKQKDLRKLVSIFEPGTGTEISRGSKADSQEGAVGTPTHKVSMVMNRQIPDTWITSKSEPWPKNPNQPKITAPEQMRRTDYTREVKPEPTDPMSQGGQSGQGTGRRGRSEWKTVNSSNRSKSLDWGSGVSHMDKGERTGLQGYRDNSGGFLPRRSESFERGRGGNNMTTPTTKKLDQNCTSVSSRINEYILGEEVELKNLRIVSADQPVILRRSRPVSLPLQMDNRGQSLPSRIKPRLSDSEVEGDISVWGLHQSGRRIAGDVSSNKFIFGSVTSDTSTKRDAGSDRLKIKRNSLPAEDLSQYRKGGEQSHRRSSFSNDPVLVSEPPRQWIGVPYEGRQGGTFPRRYSKEEKKDCETGSTWICRNGNDGSNISSLRSSNRAMAWSEWSGDRSPRRRQQTQTSLTERDEKDYRLLDRGRNSQPFSVKPRSVISIPKVTSPQQQVQSTLDSAAITVKDLPQTIQSKAVTDGWEKEREYKKGKGEMKVMGSDLDPEREEERNKIRHEGGFCDRKTEGKLTKHEESKQSCSKTKEPKPLKAKAFSERSPAVKFCEGTDSFSDSLPKMKLASVSQPASSALGGVNKESKQDLADFPGGRPEYSLVIQPTLKSSQPINWRGHKEKGEEQDDVFRLNSTPRVPGNRPNGEFKTGVDSTSSDNVRSKINRFETLSQQSRSMPPYHQLWSRRALSVPDHPTEVLGVTKSNSDKALGGIRRPGPVGPAEKQYFKRVGRGEADEGVRRNWEVRSSSVDEGEQRRDFRGREVLDSGISFPQQTKWSAYKDASYNSTINTEPQRDFKAPSDEPDSSRASQHETKYASGQQGEISKPVITKDRMPTLQTNYNNSNSNGVGRVTGITNISGKNTCDSKNISETDKGDKTRINSSSRSPFISNNKSYGTSGSTCPDKASERIPQTSASTRSTTEAAPPPVCRVNGIPSASSTPAPESAPKNSLLHPATSSSSTDPQLYSQVTHQNQAVGPKESYGAALARWSSDEDLWDDDDDDEGTEKGSNYDSDSGESSVTITSNMSQSDRLSFSVSLADLCNFGALDYKGQDDDPDDMEVEGRLSHRTASLSSDISALSSISIMPTEELDQLLDEVKGLGEETLQNYEDVQVVVLHKEVGCGLGFTVAGGVDQNKPITVHKVFPSGLASQEGSMREGDQVLSINGTALKDSAHWEALRILRRARTRPMAVVVLQKGGATETKKNSADCCQAAVDQHTAKKGRTIQVVLNKFSTDLGFSLEGGLGSNTGDRPLTVKKLFQGGPVDHVFPGDELLEIEGQTIQGLRRLEAWNLIKKLPPGPVDVVLNRPFRPQ